MAQYFLTQRSTTVGAPYGAGFTTPLIENIGALTNGQWILQGKMKIDETVVTNGYVLAYVPVEATPSEILTLVAGTHGGTCRVDLHPNGELRYNSTGGAITDWLCLDGIVFSGKKG